ncbi:hypothetical protein B0684_03315 [Thioalkalivibrio versutus]|nr:hypothetical protein B0684_03315 [Thioalkalivibrio versutus]
MPCGEGPWRMSVTKSAPDRPSRQGSAEASGLRAIERLLLFKPSGCKPPLAFFVALCASRRAD